MSKKYVTGLVVGKFCPLHKGHELLIKTALDRCDKVIVISYTSENFINCSPRQRLNWLIDLGYDEDRLKIHVLDHKTHNFPLDIDPPEYHREFIADFLVNDLETSVQAVFTSEEYGAAFALHLENYFAANLGTRFAVESVLVDLGRNFFPISGTLLRSEHGKELRRTFLNPSVFFDTKEKVVFVGGESTGKSTIVKSLSEKYNVPLIEEFGRRLYDKRNQNLLYEDMLYIAKTQLHVEYLSSVSNNDYPLFCDTSPLTTAFYSQEIFGRIPLQLSDLVEECAQRYSHVFLCCPDFPFVQDGTRKDSDFRLKAHSFYLDHFKKNNIRFTMLQGNNENRIKMVESVLSL